MNKWKILHNWLIRTRYATAPVTSDGLKAFYQKKAKVELLDEIIEYMYQLDEEEDDET